MLFPMTENTIQTYFKPYNEHVHLFFYKESKEKKLFRVVKEYLTIKFSPACFLFFFFFKKEKRRKKRNNFI